jgi:TRAP-type C4-dicarboxylate transport system permease small subunit
VTAATRAAASFHGALERALQPVEAAAAILGGVFMLTAMVLTSADALMRYAFNAPIIFNFYLTEKYLLVGLMTLPMAWGFRTGGYIRLVSALYLLPPLGRSLLLRTGLLVSGAYVAVLASLSGKHFWEVYQRGDVQMGIIDWPMAWSWVWVPLGLGLLALRLFLMASAPSLRTDTPESLAAQDAV